MTDPRRVYNAEGHEVAPLDDPAEPIEEPIIAAGIGGVVADPLGPIDDHDDPAENAMEAEQDWEAPEGDDALMSGHSPEFQRLTKPTQ